MCILCALSPSVRQLLGRQTRCLPFSVLTFLNDSQVYVVTAFAGESAVVPEPGVLSPWTKLPVVVRVLCVPEPRSPRSLAARQRFLAAVLAPIDIGLDAQDTGALLAAGDVVCHERGGY